MTKQLIIVVHGVGVKEAGVSADLLATALDDTPEDNKNLNRTKMNAARLRPHSSDDFHLREMEKYNLGGKRQVFPARIRRYRHKDIDSKRSAERVVADFYWGDISNIASGLLGLLLGLLKTVLGLSHIIRENAFSAFPAKEGYDWVMRRLAEFAALTIHGPVAAINILLVIGAFLNLGLGKIIKENPTEAIWATGLVCAALGIYLSKTSPVFLTRFLGGWLTLIALVFLVLSWSLPTVGIGLGYIGGIADAVIIEKACASAQGKLDLCMQESKGIFLQGMRLIAIMSYFFVAAIAAAVVLSVAELVRSFKHPNQLTPSIASPTIALMFLLWILFIGVVWAVLRSTVSGLIPDAIPLEGIFGALIYCVIGLVAVAIGALISFIRTKIWAGQFNPENYIDKANRLVAEKFANNNRMITSSFLIWPLRLFLLSFALFAIFATTNLHKVSLPGDQIVAPLISIQKDTFANVLLLLTTIGGLAIAAGQAPLRSGLGIAIDVITWLNDHCWNSAERGHTSGKTIFERALPMIFYGNPMHRSQGYWRRDRIKQRFDVLATQLIRDERPDRLVIVSHSQGTVVAIDVLNSEGKRYLSLMPEGGEISLVTMGSPYTHVHNHYFTRAFANVDKMPTLAPIAERGILADWLNIFRIDDFVGTHIDPIGNWPREQAVPANGHTSYWVDENVFEHLKEFTKLTDD